MFARKNSKSKKPVGHRRAASVGSAPRLFVSPPKVSSQTTSRNEQRVRKAPCAHLASTTPPLDDEATVSVTTVPEHSQQQQQQQITKKKSIGFFVNPPSFCIDETTGSGNHTSTTTTHLQTLGVPMMGTCSDFFHSPAKPSGPPRRVVSTGSTNHSSSTMSGPRVLVNPPAFATTTTLGGNRVRKTWGVPMV